MILAYWRTKIAFFTRASKFGFMSKRCECRLEARARKLHVFVMAAKNRLASAPLHARETSGNGRDDGGDGGGGGEGGENAAAGSSLLPRVVVGGLFLAERARTPPFLRSLALSRAHAHALYATAAIFAAFEASEPSFVAFKRAEHLHFCYRQANKPHNSF